MNRPVIIIGSGGHAKVLVDTLLLQGKNILGLTDKDVDRQDQFIRDIQVIGDDSVIKRYSPQDIILVNGVGSVGVPTLREAIFQNYKKMGYDFLTVIHPSVILSADVHLGEGVQIMAGAIIQPGTTIGNNTIINTKVSVDHDCTIGEHVHLAPGVTLSGNVRIENVVHIGTGATAIQNVRIGKGSLIGAGSLIIKDISEKQIVFGVPARI